MYSNDDYNAGDIIWVMPRGGKDYVQAKFVRYSEYTYKGKKSRNGVIALRIDKKGAENELFGFEAIKEEKK